MGVTPEQFRAMEQRLEQNRGKKRPSAPIPSAPVTPIPPSPVSGQDTDIIFSCKDGYLTKEFTFHGKPLGKPRMTQRDKFVMRPACKRYWDFKAAIRTAAGTLPDQPDMVIVSAWVPMPPSWSKKKSEAMNGQPCRQKPDWDNIGKAVCDALFDEDCCIWVGATIKYWCVAGAECLIVKVLYAKPK